MSYATGHHPLPKITAGVHESFKYEFMLPEINRKTTLLKEINSIISSCLAVEPEHRPTAMNLKLQF